MIKPSQSRVRIFGNGMMQYQAAYKLPTDKPSNFEMTVKQEHLDDILSTMQLQGNLKITKPFTFSATNAEESRLRISENDPLVSLLNGMRGSQVAIKVPGHDYVGRNMGVDVEETTVLGGENTVYTRSMLLMSDGRIRRIDIDTIEDWGFTDHADQMEVEKALDKMSSEIRPGTTIVRFGLQGNGTGSAPATLQWVVPNAAYVMTYRLHSHADDKFTLDAFASIHNFTDQPWESTTVEIISGSPHTFAGSSAEAILPERTVVDLVDRHAIGGRVAALSKAMPRQVNEVRRTSAGISSNISINNLSVGDSGGGKCFDSQSFCPGGLSAPDYEVAEIVDAGGMQCFVCPTPIALLEAKKSILVFMFSKSIKGKKVLIYNEKNGVRPDAAFLLKNDTEVNLPRGPIAIDEATDEMHMGKTILEAMQPDQERKVIYATDHNVTVNLTRDKIISQVVGLHLKNGLSTTKNCSKATTIYSIENAGDEVQLCLDHARTIATSKVVVNGEHVTKKKEVANGDYRAYVKVPAKTTISVEFVETYQQFYKASFGIAQAGHNAKALMAVLGNTSQSIIDTPAIQKVLNLAKRIDAKEAEITLVQGRITNLNKQHTRAKSTMESIKSGPEHASFVKELTDLYNSIKAEEDVHLPKLQKEKVDLSEIYSEAIKELAVSWDV